MSSGDVEAIRKRNDQRRGGCCPADKEAHPLCKSDIDTLLGEIERLTAGCSIDHHYAVNRTVAGKEISCRCGSLRSGTEKLEAQIAIAKKQRREADDMYRRMLGTGR